MDRKWKAHVSVRKERKVRPGFTPTEDVARFRPRQVAQREDAGSPRPRGASSLADLVRANEARKARPERHGRPTRTDPSSRADQAPTWKKEGAHAGKAPEKPSPRSTPSKLVASDAKQPISKQEPSRASTSQPKDGRERPSEPRCDARPSEARSSANVRATDKASGGRQPTSHSKAACGAPAAHPDAVPPDASHAKNHSDRKGAQSVDTILSGMDRLSIRKD